MPGPEPGHHASLLDMSLRRKTICSSTRTRRVPSWRTASISELIRAQRAARRLIRASRSRSRLSTRRSVKVRTGLHARLERPSVSTAALASLLPLRTSRRDGRKRDRHCGGCAIHRPF